MTDALTKRYACACCRSKISGDERATVAREWEHRLNGFCYACASMRCDAYPGSHGEGTQTKAAWVAFVAPRRGSRSSEAGDTQ